MSELFVGKMEYANGDWARIAPLACLEAGRWAPVEEPHQAFPDEGLVFVPPAIGLGHAPTGTYWVFSREPNARAVAGKDRFIVVHAEPAVPVVDLSAHSLEEARVKLFDQGVELPRGCGDRAVVAVARGLFCVIDFKPDSNGRRHARSSRNPVQLMTLPPRWLDCGVVEGRRLLPLAVIPNLPPVRTVNWCDDAEFVERVVLRARKHFAQFGSPDALPGKETLQRIARALEREELLLGSGDDVELDMERLRSQWPKLVSRFMAAEAMKDFVLESDVAVELIEQACHDAALNEAERIRPIVESQVRDALKAEIDTANEQRDRVLAAISESQARLDQANVELARLERAQADAAAQAREAERKVRELAEALERQLHALSPKEVPFVRAFLERLGNVLGGKTAIHRLPTSSPPWMVSLASVDCVAVTLQSLPDALRLCAESNGLASLIELDAFARAGEVVLLVGDCIELALSAYAECVAGGNVWTMALDPSVIGLDDLWAAPPERSPTGFAMAWSHAEAHPDEAVIVCLRSIDASPMHLWLPSLAAVLNSRSRPRNLLVVATPLGAVLEDAGREYPDHARLLKWVVPVRVTLAANGALRALGRLTRSGLKGSALRFADCAPDSLRLTPAQTVALSRLGGESVSRAARLAMSTGEHAHAERLVAEWAAVLEAAQSGTQYPWLGVHELKGMRYQD